MDMLACNNFDLQTEKIQIHRYARDGGVIF